MKVALFTVHKAVSFKEVNRVIAKFCLAYKHTIYDLDFESFILPQINLAKGFETWDVMIGTMTVCPQIIPYFSLYSQPYYTKKAIFYGVVEGKPIISDRDKEVLKNRLVVPSKFVYDELKDVGLTPNKIVPHGIDHEEYKVDPKEVEAFREYWKGHKILLYIGNADPRKAIPRMIEALAIVKEKIQDWVLLLMTDPRMYDKSVLGQPPLDYLIEKYKLKLWIQKIGNFGHQTRHDIALWLNACDLLLLPSYCEGFGIPLIEAGACHKTVVTIDAPPMNEIVNDKCAYLVPYRGIEYKQEHPIMIYKKHVWDVQEFAETVVYALENMDETREKGEKNYENSLRYNYMNVYRELFKE